MLGESQQQVHEAVGHIAPSQEAESSVAAQLVCLPTLGPQSVDWCCPHLRWALLPPLTQRKKKKNPPDPHMYKADLDGSRSCQVDS